jgi:hypothetical protein
VQPKGVIFDLLGLEYEWGNAICGLALPLVRKDRSFRPSCLVAQGKTAAALRGLLIPSTIFGLAGTQLRLIAHESILTKIPIWAFHGAKDESVSV